MDCVRAKVLFAGCLFAMLAGCGGGGGGNSAIPTPDPTVPVGSLYNGEYILGDGAGGGTDASGGAGDGSPIVGGLVTVSDSIGHTVTTTTDYTGRWRVSVAGFGSPLIATVQKGDRKLVSFSPRVPTIGKTISINITGLSDKIASDIVSATGQTGSTKLTGAAITAQGANINGMIQALNTSISGLLTQYGLNPSTFDPMTTPLTLNHTGYDAVLDSLNIQNGANQPTTVVPLTPLEAAKEFFGALRDTSEAYSNSGNTGDLDQADLRLSTVLGAATSPIDVDVMREFFGVQNGEKLYTAFQAGASPSYTTSYGDTVIGQTATKSSSGAAVTPSSLPEYGCELAQVTTTVTGTGDTDVATYRFAGAFATGPSTTAPALPASSVNAFSCYGVGVRGRMLGTELDDGLSRWGQVIFLPQTDGSYKYISETRKRPMDLTGQYPTTTTRNSTRDGAAKFGTVTRVHGATSVTGFHMAGQLTPGLRQLRQRTVAERSLFAHYVAALDIDSTSTSTQTTTTVAGNISLVKSDASVASSGVIAPGSTLTRHEPDGTQTGMNLGVTVQAPNFKFEGSIAATAAQRDSTNVDATYFPTNIVLAGKLYESDGGGGLRLLLDGSFTQSQTNRPSVDTGAPETATNFLKYSDSFTGKMYLRNRPETDLTVTIQDTSFTTRSITANFVWDGGWGFNITGTDDLAANVTTLNFVSTTNISFTTFSNKQDQPQKIFKGTLEVGNITVSTKRINYSDGTFEQF